MAEVVQNAVASPTVETSSGRDAGSTVGPATSTAEPSSGGLPQFQFQHWPGQIAYLLILFAALYILMSRVFAPRIRRVFDERARVVNEALASARNVQAEAAAHAQDARRAVEEARGRAAKTARDAKLKAAEDSKSRQAALEAELNTKLSHAETRIHETRDAAMSGVVSIAEDTARSIVEKLTGIALGPDETILASYVKG
jgi:F-type H+-transporting ATPase subunit b